MNANRCQRVTMLVVGLGGRFDFIPLGARFEWLESTPALIVFGVAVLAEVLADKIPVVDHALERAYVLEERAHIPQMANRHPDLADLGRGQGVVAVVTRLGR